MKILRTVFFCAIFSLSACGNRTDISTAHGRQAVIDETNLYLSNGDCQSALNAINPLYNSAYVDDEIRILMASADACFSGFQMLNLLTNITNSSSFFKAIAETMPNTLGDGRIGYLYGAIDVMTSAGTKLLASQRSAKLNDFMVFLGMATAGAIQNAYGKADSQGNKTAAFFYKTGGPGTALSDTDACAYAAAISFIVDSFDASDLAGNSQASSAVSSLNTLCVAGGLTCASLNKDRTQCAVAGTPQNNADTVAQGTNAAW